MATDLNERQPQTAVYVLVLTVQIVAAVFFIWSELPTFRQLVLNPGKQIPDVPLDDLATAGIIFVMQGAYWCRQRCIPIPFVGSNAFLNHILLFMGRLSFIFGAAVFSVIFFRHLPELGPDVDILLMVRRGLLVFVSLFALFCFTLELERLGNAFGNNPRT